MSSATYEDDPSIPDQAQLWRRIPHWHFFFDQNLGLWRPSSAAFDDEELSVALADIVAATGGGPETVLTGHEGFALAAISAGLARECRQAVVRDPLPDDPAHSLVAGAKPKSILRRLAKESLWVIPPNVETPP